MSVFDRSRRRRDSDQPCPPPSASQEALRSVRQFKRWAISAALVLAGGAGGVAKYAWSENGRAHDERATMRTVDAAQERRLDELDRRLKDLGARIDALYPLIFRNAPATGAGWR